MFHNGFMVIIIINEIFRKDYSQLQLLKEASPYIKHVVLLP